MRYAIFSDMHSNLEAFRAFLEDSKKERVDRYFCLGDIVGYGADPHECIELTKALKCPVVCGNHDAMAFEEKGVENFNLEAKEAILWTRYNLDGIDKNFLNHLKLVHTYDELTLVHGSLYYPGDFNYIFNIVEAGRCMDLQETELCFVGHSHVPGICLENDKGHVRYTDATDMDVKKPKRYLINVGSVGQPRDRDPRGAYCIYDKERHLLHIKRFTYDIETAQAKIKKAGLPLFLAERLALGR